MASPSVITPQKRQPQLEKAKLKAYNSEAPDIDLMFNPSEISFSRSVNWQQDPGNRGTSLLPKVNFSGVNPYRFTLKQLIFDTYETKQSVMDYVNIIKKGVETIDSKPDTRPPVYTFVWKDEYFYCVMVSLTYTLNMFLTDGTPVRAMVDISLQEVDKNYLPGGSQSAAATQRANNPQSASLFNGGGQPNLAGGQPNQVGGKQNQASGQPNLASGQPNLASGQPNLAGGQPNQAGGKQNQASGQPNLAGGKQNQASGQPNLAGGQPNQAGGKQNQASGQQNQAGGKQNQAGGQQNQAGGKQNQAGGGKGKGKK